MSKSHMKSMLFKIKYVFSTDDYDDAIHYLEKALKYKPDDHETKRKLDALRAKVKFSLMREYLKLGFFRKYLHPSLLRKSGCNIGHRSSDNE
jgi:tetratricopeptide (TPR) repeat protein